MLCPKDDGHHLQVAADHRCTTRCSRQRPRSGSETMPKFCHVIRSIFSIHTNALNHEAKRQNPGYNRIIHSQNHQDQNSHHLLRMGPSKCQSPSLEMNSWFQSSRALFAFSMNMSMVMPSSQAIAGLAARHQRRARYSSVQGGWHIYIRRQLACGWLITSSVGRLSLGYITLTSLHIRSARGTNKASKIAKRCSYQVQ